MSVATHVCTFAYVLRSFDRCTRNYFPRFPLVLIRNRRHFRVLTIALPTVAKITLINLLPIRLHYARFSFKRLLMQIGKLRHSSNYIVDEFRKYDFARKIKFCLIHGFKLCIEDGMPCLKLVSNKRNQRVD